jgi:hypothetical protein
MSAGPVLCAWCEQNLALIGLGDPLCPTCREALHPSQRHEPDEYEQAIEDEFQARGGGLESSARYPQVRSDQYGPPPGGRAFDYGED